MPEAHVFPPSAMTMDEYERLLENWCEPLPETEFVSIDRVITWLSGRGLDLYAVELNQHLFGSMQLLEFRELLNDFAGVLEAEFADPDHIDDYQFWRATNKEEIACLERWLSIVALDPAELSHVVTAVHDRLGDQEGRHSDIVGEIWNVIRRGGLRHWARRADPQTGVLKSTDWEQVPSEFFSKEFAFCEHDGLYPNVTIGDRSFVRPGDTRPAWRHPRILRVEAEFLRDEVRLLKGRINSSLSGVAAEEYYEHRIRSWPPNTVPPAFEEDLKACQDVGMTHATHRAVRRKLAPPNWKKAGRKKRDERR